MPADSFNEAKAAFRAASAIGGRSGRDMLNLSLSGHDLTRPGPRADIKVEPHTPALPLLKGKDHRLGPCYSASIGLPRAGGAR